jgi:phosphoesterase RecJ-like protein
MNNLKTDITARARIVEEIHRRHRFVLSSHERPDGDAIGSQMAMALALKELGKEVRVVNKDLASPPILTLPNVREIEIADSVTDAGDAAIVMECSDLSRTGVSGLDKGFVINIDHHLGNTMYGAINWLDTTASACGEMVFNLVQTLGVPISKEIAAHIYAAILTDTGSFHHSSISAQTFDICRQCVEAGINPVTEAQVIFDNNNLSRLRLFGMILNQMELDDTGKVAIIHIDREMARQCSGTYEETEGIINFPLTVKKIQGVAFLKEIDPGTWRVSLRSKGDVNVNAVAKLFGGGGHKNASGCSVNGKLSDLKILFRQEINKEIKIALTRQARSTESA